MESAKYFYLSVVMRPSKKMPFSFRNQIDNISSSLLSLVQKVKTAKFQPSTSIRKYHRVKN